MQTSTRTTTARSNRAGFTLAEVLVVIIIMSGILMTISSVLASARETRDMIHNMNETQLAGPAILDLVESDLRGLLTYSMRPSKVLRVTSREISGKTADRIDFVTSSNSRLFELGEARALRADYNEVGYVLREREDSDVGDLELFRREDFGVDEDPFVGGKYLFLHDQVRKFEILVFEEDGPDAEPLEEWNTANEPDNRLPLRIEIVLEIETAARITNLANSRERNTLSKYRRVFRIGSPAHLSFSTEPVAKIPDVPKPRDQTGGDGLTSPFSDSIGGQGGFGGGVPTDAFGGSNSGNPFEGLDGSGTEIQIDGGTTLIDIFNQAGGAVQGGGGGGGGG
jgi:prepilin-type N-terminal cleavage/methylation domain-containing protein